MILEEFIICNGLLNSYLESRRKICIVKITSKPNESNFTEVSFFLIEATLGYCQNDPSIKWNSYSVSRGWEVTVYVYSVKQFNQLGTENLRGVMG